MSFIKSTLLASALALPFAAGIPHLLKRDGITWGPMITIGPTTGGQAVTSVIATVYPGSPPSSQAGGLYNWIGLNNEDESGGLIQGIVGQYVAGQSECSGTDRDTLWCISAEVYGETSSGSYNQWVGDLRTLEQEPAQGVTFNYTLADKDTGLWVQHHTNAATGDLMASFQKTSDETITYINTAVECQDCTAPVDVQTWENVKIVLETADEGFGDTIYELRGATASTPSISDGGKTWTIKKITIPVATPEAV